MDSKRFERLSNLACVLNTIPCDKGMKAIIKTLAAEKINWKDRTIIKDDLEETREYEPVSDEPKEEPGLDSRKHRLTKLLHMLETSPLTSMSKVEAQKLKQQLRELIQKAA